MATKQANIAVVMVPFPAQGHLNQVLHLSRLIAAYNFPVHIISSTTHGRQAKARIHGWDPLASSNVHFHEFPTPHFPSPSPNPDASIKFPSHLIPSLESSSHLREPFATLLSTLSPVTKRVVVIFDYMMGSVVQDVVSFANVEAYLFLCCSAFASFWYQWEVTRSPTLDVELEALRQDLPSDEGCFSEEDMEFLLSRDGSCKKFISGTLHDACRVVEEKYINLLEQEETQDHKKLWALGPFNPVSVSAEKNSSLKLHKYLFEWLDKQAPSSVIYVSFGTTVSLSNEQIHEIALGLEGSEQKFIWVLKDADKGNIFEGGVRRIELPKGYEERVQGNGLVVRDWVPQLEILGHPSTGGFMSHCGWNSSMESITMGVSIAAWPMHSDQPKNAMLITKVLNIGIYVRDWADREKLVTSSMIQEVIKRLMVSEEGNEMRKRAAKLGDGVRRSMADGGVTKLELDSFIAHVTR